MSKEKKFEENLADLEAIVQNWKVGMWLLKKLHCRIPKGMKLSKNCKIPWIKQRKPWSGSCRQMVLEADLA